MQYGDPVLSVPVSSYSWHCEPANGVPAISVSKMDWEICVAFTVMLVPAGTTLGG